MRKTLALGVAGLMAVLLAAPATASQTAPMSVATAYGSSGQCPDGYTQLMETYSGGLSWTADADYSSVILVGGPPYASQNLDPDGRDKYFSDVSTGDVISRVEHTIVHVCAIPADTYVPARVTPEAPTFVDVCGTENDDYTVPANTETVTYQESWSQDGTTLTVTASLVDERDVFAPYVDTEWSFTFTDLPCADTYVPVVVTPAVPTFTDLCGTESDDHMVPADTETVTYQESWSQDGTTLTVTASLVDERDVFAPYVDTEWSFTFTDEPCASGLVVVTPVRPTVTDATITCTMPSTLVVHQGSITVPTTAGVEYLLDGAVIRGTIAVDAGTYAVTARAATADHQLSQPVADLTVTVGTGVAPACSEVATTVTTPLGGTTTVATPLGGTTTGVSAAAPGVTSAVRGAALAQTGAAALPLQLLAIAVLVGLGAVVTAGSARIRSARAK